MKRTNANTLKAFWSKQEKDLVFHHPDYAWNGRLVHNAFCSERPRVDRSGDVDRVVFDKSFVAELEERGYDITTLRFSICKKEPKP